MTPLLPTTITPLYDKDDEEEEKTIAANKSKEHSETGVFFSLSVTQTMTEEATAAAYYAANAVQCTELRAIGTV